METIFWKLVFWTGVAWLGYVYAGYPVLMGLMARRRPVVPFAGDGDAPWPRVTLFVPVFNEAGVIRQKIANLLALDYPADRLEILVASDGSTDGTDDILRAVRHPRVKVFISPENQGKNTLINRFVGAAGGELVVFTDANALFAPDALYRLAAPFRDPRVGFVGGKLAYLDAASSVAKGEGAYFRYENILKRLEGRRGHLIVSNGAIYAIRKDLFVPVPVHVPNDFFHPLAVLKTGHLSVYAEDAVAHEKPSQVLGEEFRRRTRIVARSVGTLFELRRLPGTLGGSARFSLLSHKVLRWMGLPVLAMMLVANLYLLAKPAYGALFALQALFWALALLGLAGEWLNIRRRLFYIPYYFWLINAAGTVGMLLFLTGKRFRVWRQAPSTR